MPVRGRLQQTLELIPRLFATAGEPFNMAVVVDEDHDTALALHAARLDFPVVVIENDSRAGYWASMERGSREVRGDLLINLANDLLPGREWLKRALAAHLRRFPDGQGVTGLNDGVHPGTHAGHFIAARKLLQAWYAPHTWPIQYMHLWGDSEIVMRAMEAGKFCIAPWAVMFHNHPASGAQSDEVYKLGHSSIDSDRELFDKRRHNGWQ